VRRQAVRTERRGAVLLITLDRPEAMNAIDADLSQGLLAAVAELDEDPGLRAGVLTGAGRGFSAGMDLKAFARGEDVSALMTFVEHGAAKPLIAAVEGFALAGGLELALSCDLVVAAAGARLGIPETTVGLFAAGGGLLRLPGRVGYAKAMEMALTGEPITAEDAEALGLVARTAEPGRAVEVALQLAERIAANAPLAVVASRDLIKATPGLTEKEFWQLQADRQSAVFSSADAVEGPRAFAEKRAPMWAGR
jgi:enoyl-CoA hydratase